jgi:hypothetical protein
MESTLTNEAQRAHMRTRYDFLRGKKIITRTRARMRGWHPSCGRLCGRPQTEGVCHGKPRLARAHALVFGFTDNCTYEG